MNSSEAATPKRVTPKLRDDVRLEMRTVGGTSGGVLIDERDGRFFQLGGEEAAFLKVCLQAEDIVRGTAEAKRMGLAWSDEDVTEFFGKLRQSRLLDWITETDMADPGGSASAGHPSGKPISDAARQPETPPNMAPGATGCTTWFRSTIATVSKLLSLRIPVGDFDRISLRLHSGLGCLTDRRFVWIWLTAIVVSWGYVATHLDRLSGQWQRWFDSGDWVFMLGVWVATKLWHECGHAVVAKRYGVRVGTIGVMFFLMAPLAYVDITDAWRLRSRWARVAIALGGIYFEALLSVVAIVLWALAPDNLLGHLAAQTFVLAGPATWLINGNPLLRLDGYYVVSDAADIPNLRGHGRQQLSALIGEVLFGDESSESVLDGWRKPFATMHAAASIVFQVMWMSALVVGVSLVASGAGIVLAAVAVLLWAIVPAATAIVKRVQLATTWRKRMRLISTVVCIGMTVQIVLSLRNPIARRVPVFVQAQDAQWSRAPSDAFVRTVWVRGGQRVRRGQPLVQLHHDDLMLRIEELENDRLQALHESVGFRHRGELAESAAAMKRADSIDRQLDELRSQRDAWLVTAEHDGVIAASDLDGRLGEFVEAGDPLLRVIDPLKKRLIVSIDEDASVAYREAVRSGLRVEVRMRGGGTFRTVPGSPGPEASTELPMAAMAATHGGPLAVTKTENDWQTLHPRLTARCPIPASYAPRLYDGQIGSMRLSDDVTIGRRLLGWFLQHAMGDANHPWW